MSESKLLTRLLAGAAGAVSRADGLDDRDDPESSQNGSDVACEGGQESGERTDEEWEGQRALGREGHTHSLSMR